MNEVSFPGLGLDFQINPVAFRLFGWEVYWYGIIIAAGFVLAVVFCMRQTKYFGPTTDDFLDVLLWAVPGALIGARLYYVIFNLDTFRHADGSIDVMQLFRVHDGGMAIYGGILAAVLIAWLVMRKKRIPFLAMADLSAFGLLIGQCIGRWGNFVNMEAFGGETTLPWRMGIMEWVNGAPQYREVHPTFFYESLWTFLGFFLLLFLFKKGLRKFDGMLFFMYVAWYGVGRGIIEGLRTDSLYFLDTGIRVSQVLGFATAIAAVIYILYRLSQKPDQDALYVNQKNKKREVPTDGGNNP